ncbi:3-oxoacyl-ACP synthase [Halobacillus salinus]|uniref:3-oxoacyl-ACP synthase n=1 Tax=Halobacillus salinus TaxID=192814 RepID=A0A4Z0GUY0_9BACI|nr:3-oxoacyl-ACP synthase [Halobacillus salinus]TGB01018.1 3-oxoacyl-ACP synthase [Halobacillus salinus]
MIGIEKTSIYVPERVETAADLSGKTGIPEDVIIQKFGLRQKHIADASMHASDLAVAAGKKILESVSPASIDVLIYFGSPFKDHQVWTASSKIQHELGLTNAYAFELMNVSSCFPLAVKVAKDMLRSDEEIENILLVGGSKESMIVSYDNPRSRFMFPFADGGAAALMTRHSTKWETLASSVVTDGSFSKDVLVPGGGSVDMHPDEESRYIDVPDPSGMKERLDPVSLQNFERVIKQSLEKSGADELELLLPLHTKRSMFLKILESVGLEEHQAVYLDGYGHMSALDPCYGLYLAEKEKDLQPGDIVVIASAGTGYTWAATTLRYHGGTNKEEYK